MNDNKDILKSPEELSKTFNEAIAEGDACCTNIAYRISRKIKKHFGVDE